MFYGLLLKEPVVNPTYVSELKWFGKLMIRLHSWRLMVHKTLKKQ